VDAIEEALAAGFWTDLLAEFAGESRVFSLDGGGGAGRLGVGEGRGARPVKEVVLRCCHDMDLNAETLGLLLARHPCTSLSALQAR